MRIEDVAATAAAPPGDVHRGAATAKNTKAPEPETGAGVRPELSEQALRTAPIPSVVPEGADTPPPPAAAERLDSAEQTMVDYLFGPSLGDQLLPPERPNPMKVFAELVAAELAVDREG